MIPARILPVAMITVADLVAWAAVTAAIDSFSNQRIPKQLADG
jgi:hypothetical protein